MSRRAALRSTADVGLEQPSPAPAAARDRSGELSPLSQSAEIHSHLAESTPALSSSPSLGPEEIVQTRLERGAADQPTAAPASLQAAEARQAAAQGLSGPTQTLPYLDRIQPAFGRFDLGGVKAHVGGPAVEAAADLGASAYTVGAQVAFGGTPDLFTAAHEAAHVVQQQAGARPSGGVGRSGDVYERHADAVATRVVQGKSAEPLLRTVANPAELQAEQAVAGGAIQRDDEKKKAIASLRKVANTAADWGLAEGKLSWRMAAALTYFGDGSMTDEEFITIEGNVLNTAKPDESKWLLLTDSLTKAWADAQSAGGGDRDAELMALCKGLSRLEGLVSAGVDYVAQQVIQYSGRGPFKNLADKLKKKMNTKHAFLWLWAGDGASPWWKRAWKWLTSQP